MMISLTVANMASLPINWDPSCLDSIMEMIRETSIVVTPIASSGKPYG